MFSTPDSIEGALERLGKLMQAEGCAPIGLLVCGGAALNVLGLVARSTRDVDVICTVDDTNGTIQFVRQTSLPEDLQGPIDDVGADLGLAGSTPSGAPLPEDQKWLNLGPRRLLDFGLPDGIEMRLVRKDYGPRLSVYFVGRLDQIPLKLYGILVSQRPLTHHQDLEALHATEDEMKHAAAWVAGRPLTPGQRKQFREILWELGYVTIADELGL